MNPAKPPALSAGLRKMAVIGPAAFLNSMGIGSVNLGLIFILREVFHAPPAMVGRFGALWSLVYFASCLVFRNLTARLVPRNSMTFMTAASAVIILSLCAVPSLPAAFIAYSAFGAVLAFFWPPLMGWLSRGLEGRDLSRATGLFSFSWSLGGIVSPYLAGTLSERGKFLPLWFAVAMFTANAVFLQVSKRFLRDSDERPAPSLVRSASVRDESTPLRFSAWTSVFVLYAAIGILANIFPLFARAELGLSESRTGLLITVRTAATTAGFLFFGRSSFWRFRKGLLPVPTSLAAGAALILALAAGVLPVLAAGLVIFGFAAAWAYNSSMFYGASGASDRDRRMTVHEALLTVGQVFGSLLGGILYQASSMRAVFLFTAFLAGAGVWTQSWMARRRFGETPAQRPPLGMDGRLFPGPSAENGDPDITEKSDELPGHGSAG